MDPKDPVPKPDPEHCHLPRFIIRIHSMLNQIPAFFVDLGSGSEALVEQDPDLVFEFGSGCVKNYEKVGFFHPAFLFQAS
jgi:hypothetical protein